MSSVRVSIGLPVYNGANYVAEAIESALAQTNGDLELVISDNASSDATEEICREFASRDGRVRYARAEQNGGAAWNFNRTFELSRGEYFKWLAHDDAIDPQYLARCVNVLDQDPTVVLCHTRTGIINGRGELVADDGTEEFETWEIQGVTPENERQRLNKVRSTKPHARYLGVLLYSIRNHEMFGVIRRAEMAKTALHGAYRGGEKVFLAELCLRGAFHEVPELLSFSRWHNDRFSSNASARAQALHMNPNVSHPLRWPRQVRATYGYWQSIVRSELGWKHRAGCLLGLGWFLLQENRWRSAIAEYAGRAGQTATLPELYAGENGQATGRHWSALK